MTRPTDSVPQPPAADAQRLASEVLSDPVPVQTVDAGKENGAPDASARDSPEHAVASGGANSTDSAPAGSGNGEWAEFPSRGPDVRLFSFVISVLVLVLAVYFLFFGPSIEGFARSNDFWLVLILICSPLIGTACFLFALHSPPFVVKVDDKGQIYLAKLHWIPGRRIQQQFGPFDSLCWLPNSVNMEGGDPQGGDTMLHRVWLGGIRLQPPMAERVYGTSDANAAACRKFLQVQGVAVTDIRRPSLLAALFEEVVPAHAVPSACAVDPLLRARARMKAAAQGIAVTVAVCVAIAVGVLEAAHGWGVNASFLPPLLLGFAFVGVCVATLGAIRAGRKHGIQISGQQLKITHDFSWKRLFTREAPVEAALADVTLELTENHPRWILVSVRNGRLNTTVVQVYWHITHLPDLILLCRSWDIPHVWKH
jgi:hypothetical protein